MIRPLLFASALSLASLTGGALAFGQTAVSTSDATASRSIVVAKDKSLAFRLDAAVGELVVAQPDIAEIVAKTDHSFYIRGKKAGATNILVYGPTQQLVEVIDVRVGPDAEALRQDLAANMPGETIKVSNFADGVLLSGSVSTNGVAMRAKQVALRYAPDAVTTNLTVRDPQQVILEVRIIEATKTSLHDAGVNVNVMGPNGSISSGAGVLGITPPAGTFTISGHAGTTTLNATLEALEDKGVIKTLARPDLAALSGEEASFLVGGEFPFPVPTQLDQVTIEFKPFGVTLKFTPEVEDNGMIKLKVAPEVSAINNDQVLKINGFNVPSLTTRKASTTVELEPGKSFAIAGLLQQDDVSLVRQTPGLGDIPILGALFKSTRWNKDETELVVIVTPRLAGVDEPVTDPLKGDPHFDHPATQAAPAAPASRAPQGPVAAAPAPTLAPSAALPSPPLAALAPELLPVPVEKTLAPVPPPVEVAGAAQPATAVATASPGLPKNIDEILQRMSQGPDPAQPGV